MMFSQNQESCKPVYIALPLLAQEENVDKSMTMTENNSMSSLSSTFSSTLHFLTGATMGMVCFYVVPAHVFPFLPQMSNPWANCIFFVLTWGGISSAVVCSLWKAVFILSYQVCRTANDGGNNKRTAMREALYWEEMEHCYQLGALLAFIAVGIFSLVWTNVNRICWLTIFICSVCVWTGTGIMVLMELHELRNVRSKTTLPMVVV